MTRVIILGGLGRFGRTAAEQLRGAGVRVQTASRSASADLRVDANDPASIRGTLRTGDLVIDTAGPFQTRTMSLVEAAIDIGFDVIDINDNLNYCKNVLDRQPRIDRAGIRVLSSASTVSAVSATVVRNSGIDTPVRVMAFLAPATRHTANAGTLRSLLASIGRPIEIYRDGRLQQLQGWSEAREFTMPQPIGRVQGRLFESADALNLPRIWPTLRDVAMYVDPNALGGTTLLKISARWPTVRHLADRHARWGAWWARRLGSSAGGIAYEIADADGTTVRWAITARPNSFVAAIAPAVLAARAIVQRRFGQRGLVPPDQHVGAADLFRFLRSVGVRMSQVN